MTKENESFHYAYSAAQQEEVKKIRQKYLPKEEDKMEQLRKLDQDAAKPGMIAALTVGIIGVLLLGIGMSCSMVWADKWFLPGIVIGVIGIIGVSAAYPIYARITRKRREKLAPEIVRLTDELLK